MALILGIGLLGFSVWYFFKLMDKFDDDKPNCQNCPYRKREVPAEDVEVEYETKSIRKQ